MHACRRTWASAQSANGVPPEASQGVQPEEASQGQIDGGPRSLLEGAKAEDSARLVSMLNNLIEVGAGVDFDIPNIVVCGELGCCGGEGDAEPWTRIPGCRTLRRGLKIFGSLQIPWLQSLMTAKTLWDCQQRKIDPKRSHRVGRSMSAQTSLILP